MLTLLRLAFIALLLYGKIVKIPITGLFFHEIQRQATSLVVTVRGPPEDEWIACLGDYNLLYHSLRSACHNLASHDISRRKELILSF